MKRLAYFEQSHAILLTSDVCICRTEHATPQRRTHHGHFRRNRITQNEFGIAATDRAVGFCVDETVGNDFLKIAGNRFRTLCEINDVAKRDWQAKRESHCF